MSGKALAHRSLEQPSATARQEQSKDLQEATDLVGEIELGADELAAGTQQRADQHGRFRLDPDLAEEAGAQELRQAFSIVGIGLVDPAGESSLGLTGIHAHHRQPCHRQPVIQPGREHTGLEPDALDLGCMLADRARQGGNVGRALAAPNAAALLIDDVHAG